MFGYATEKSTNRIMNYWVSESKPVEDEFYIYTECLESEKPELYNPNTLVYNSNVLISWAMNQLFTVELIPHFAAFLDFANKANAESKGNFLVYATSVNLVDTANIIIAKAIELGANI